MNSRVLAFTNVQNSKVSEPNPGPTSLIYEYSLSLQFVAYVASIILNLVGFFQHAGLEVITLVILLLLVTREDTNLTNVSSKNTRTALPKRPMSLVIRKTLSLYTDICFICYYYFKFFIHFSKDTIQYGISS